MRPRAGFRDVDADADNVETREASSAHSAGDMKKDERSGCDPGVRK